MNTNIFIGNKNERNTRNSLPVKFNKLFKPEKSLNSSEIL